MIKSEPVKGRYYIVRTFDAKGRPEGATICKFSNRAYHGCQLHGDRIGYFYNFTTFNGAIATVYARYDDGEKDFSKVMEQIGPSIAEYRGDIDPWDFTALPEKKAIAA